MKVNIDYHCLVGENRFRLLSRGESNLHIFCQHRYDYLKISNEQNQTFGSFCGYKSGQNVTVTGQYAVLTFHSDDTVNGKGYKLFFSYVSQGKVNDAYALFDKWKIRTIQLTLNPSSRR